MQKCWAFTKSATGSSRVHRCFILTRLLLLLFWPDRWTKSSDVVESAVRDPYEFSQLFQQRFPPRPCFIAGFLVSLTHGRIVGFARAHETVASAFIDHRLVSLAGGFH